MWLFWRSFFFFAGTANVVTVYIKVRISWHSVGGQSFCARLLQCPISMFCFLRNLHLTQYIGMLIRSFYYHFWRPLASGQSENVCVIWNCHLFRKYPIRTWPALASCRTWSTMGPRQVGKPPSCSASFCCLLNGSFGIIGVVHTS